MRYKNKILFNFAYGCEGFVLDSTKSIELFEFIEDEINHSLVRYNTRKYLFVVNENFEDFKKSFDNSSSSLYVSNILFILPKNSGKFEIWSPILGKREYEKVDYWFSANNSFLLEKNLYSDKFRNQQGKKIRIACFSYPPYTNCEPEAQEYYGTELKLVLEYSKIHNQTPEFVYNENEDELWGALYTNWTGTGLMGRILRDEADIAFTGFYIWEFVNHYMDLSTPYIRIGITCLVPKPRILEGWITPLLSYQPALWIIVIGNFIFDAIILHFFDYLLSKENEVKGKPNVKTSNGLLNNFWFMMQISLGQSARFRRKSFVIIERLVVGIIFLAYLILNSTYFSGLASIMTIPRYEDPIDTKVSLADANIKIRGIFEDWVLSIKEIEEETYKKITQNFAAASSDELRDMSKQNDYAFFMERLPHKNYAINDFMKDDVIENYHLMKEDVYWEYTEFFMRKSSELAPSFNMFVLRVLQSGVAAYWQRKAVYRYLDPSVQKIASMMVDTEMKQEGVVTLKFSHIEGSFGFLFIGYFLSVAAFISEQFIHYK